MGGKCREDSRQSPRTYDWLLEGPQTPRRASCQAWGCRGGLPSITSGALKISKHQFSPSGRKMPEVGLTRLSSSSGSNYSQKLKSTKLGGSRLWMGWHSLQTVFVHHLFEPQTNSVWSEGLMLWLLLYKGKNTVLRGQGTCLEPQSWLGGHHVPTQCSSHYNLLHKHDEKTSWQNLEPPPHKEYTDDGFEIQITFYIFRSPTSNVYGTFLIFHRTGFNFSSHFTFSIVLLFAHLLDFLWAWPRPSLTISLQSLYLWFNHYTMLSIRDAAVSLWRENWPWPSTPTFLSSPICKRLICLLFGRALPHFWGSANILN